MGIFTEVVEEEIFKDAQGNMILNGAMGVDKIKVANSEERVMLRFISNSVPINAYLR